MIGNEQSHPHHGFLISPGKQPIRSFLIKLRRLLRTTNIARKIYRWLPSAKRCKECLVPFLGLCSIPFSLVQIRPSRKNPKLCTL